LRPPRRYRDEVANTVVFPQLNQREVPVSVEAGPESPAAISFPLSAEIARRRSAVVPGPQPPLGEYYNALFTHFGPQHWWPAKTPFEVVIGAILTQNTSWSNVERAISNLRAARLLSPRAISKVPLPRLERLIRPSGYFRQKARKLKSFCEFLRVEYRGSLKRMFATPTIVLREKLLGVFGIGPETADSILLYAGGHPVFVVDAYTKRVLARHGWADQDAKYEEVRWIFEREFPGDARRFNEFHALIVNTGKQFCLTRDPLCHACPLGRYREEGR
jgi:endonuclease-3 related protein